ncbi:MAG: hypothetical protein ACLTCP_00850 [Ruminococcus bicirculans (ex Wegman et al. 2014)]
MRYLKKRQAFQNSVQRKEAEKAAAAEDNLSRINDIMGEIEGRIGPLKAQAEKAEKFRVLDEKKAGSLRMGA